MWSTRSKTSSTTTTRSRRASSTQPHEFEERAFRGSLFRAGSLAAVAAARAVGGLLRATVAELGGGWPWPTLAVNLAGASALGVAVMYGRRRWPPVLMAGVAVGLLGALTTFSAPAGELWNMQDSSDWEAFGSYAVATIVGGWAAALAGVRLGRSRR